MNAKAGAGERTRTADLLITNCLRHVFATRRHEFPALHPTPPPTPVEGTGQLKQIYDSWPAGTGAGIAVDVEALRLVRETGPHLVAYLDVPLDPEMLEQVRSLSLTAVA